MEVVQLLSSAFIQKHPEDAARVLELFPLKEQVKMVTESPADMSKVLEYITPGMSAHLLAETPVRDAVQVLRELSFDYKLAVFRCLLPDDRKSLYKALGDEETDLLRTVLLHSTQTAAAFMDPYVLTLPSDLTAGKALQLTKSFKYSISYYIYICERDRKLVGVVTLRELMVVDPDAPLFSFMQGEVVSLPATKQAIEIIKSPYWRDFYALPVEDEQGRFLGAIRQKTLYHIAHQVAQKQKEGDTADTLVAMGELYWTCLSSVMELAVAEAQEL